MKNQRKNKPRRAYNPLKRWDWYLITIVAGTLALSAFTSFYNNKTAKPREAQKIERREIQKREKEGDYRLKVDPKDVYLKNKNMFYEPNDVNSLENKTKKNENWERK